YAGGPNGAYDQSSIGNVQTNGNSNVSFDKVRYTTTLFSDNFRVFVGPRIDAFEIIDTNSFANNEEVDFSNGSLINNPLITFIFAGPGTGFDWKIADAFSFRGLYIANQGGNSFGFGTGGLTGSNSIGALELEVRPSQTSKIKLQYGAYTTQTTYLVNGTNFVGTPTKSNVYGVNAEWAITPQIGVFGRYGAGTATTGFLNLGAGNLQGPTNDFNLTYWSAGFSFPDLFAPGNTLGIAVGQPPRATNIASGTETDYELYYNLKVNDRITLTPDIQIISQPNNIAGNPTITVATLRLVFTF
ncbi:MAG: carbohydrate porin, partial [Gloeobacterales cyanobacterium]